MNVLRTYVAAHRRQLMALALLLLLAGALGWFAHDVFSNSAQSYRGSILRLDDSRYHFINPILACDVGTEEAFPEFAPIKQTINDIIASEKKTGAVSDVSVYVRSMKTGRWFEINADETYAPASMMKVFVAMAYYKESETQPSVLGRQIVYQASSNQDINPGEDIPLLVSGQAYSVEALIRQMIIYSDNNAMEALVDTMDEATLAAIKNLFSDLNIPSPLDQKEGDLEFMTANAYSMVYRVLYGATYISSNNSEKMLKLLSEAHFKDAMVAGVPETVAVAHKFGVYETEEKGKVTAELHDCGIVYYPNHPYLLCVMTRGRDFSELKGVIAHISQSAYAKLDAYYQSLDSAATSTLAK